MNGLLSLKFSSNIKVRFILKKILSSLLCLHCVAGFADSQTPPKDNVSVFADFIYWTARESGSDVWAEVITSKGSSYLDELRAVKFGWDPGLKVGLNYTTKHDAWDITLAYTWFHTRGTDHVTSSPGTVHSSFTGGFLVDNRLGVRSQISGFEILIFKTFLWA